MTIEGVDYAFPPRPSITGLAAAGKKFACRYGGPGTEDKWLHLDEAQALAAAGISIVANAEGAASGAMGGRSVGVAHAQSADAWFRTCGMPSDKPIYFSVDFDVTFGQWSTVADYLRGAASVIGAPRVGIYGGRHAIEWARRDGVAKWFWQTYAWSSVNGSTVWVPGNHIEQYHNGVTVAGAPVDLNRALQNDFGQWTPGNGDNSMFCKYGDKGPLVEAYQRLLIAAGASLPKFGPDGGFGDETAAGGAGLGLGDGKTYGPAEYAALQVKLAKKYAGLVAHTHTFDAPAGVSGPAVQ